MYLTKLPDEQDSIQAPSDMHTARLVLYTYALVVTSKALPLLLSKHSKQKLQLITRAATHISTLKSTLFPAALRTVYQSLKKNHGYFSSSEILASPVLLLLTPAWRVQVALYLAVSALLYSGEQSKWRVYLPPTWTLNSLGNMWLLWCFLFERAAFPKTYERVILEHSGYYVPKGMTTDELEAVITTTVPGKKVVSGPKLHIYELCAKLHPDEPSCLANYIRAWSYESNRAWKWVGSFSLLSTLLSKRGKIMQAPVKYARQWLVSTIRGTVFVVGSINTAWGLVCLLQRILPEDALPRTRFLLNGSLASLWILVLPKWRQGAISFYVARLAVLSLWEAWKNKGGCTIGYGEILLFAASWAHLAAVRRSGRRVGGLVGFGMDFVDHNEESVEND